jgi:hypothetical protein
MEALFANCEFARSDASNVSAAVGRLSLSEGEGEGEGLSKASSKRAGLNPSRQSSPLAARGEAKRATNCPSDLQTKCPWRVA